MYLSTNQTITAQEKTSSSLEVYHIDSKSRKVVYLDSSVIESPNWTADGKWFIFNKNGKLYKLKTEGGKPVVIRSGFANKCSADHVLSADGKKIAFCHTTAPDGITRIYTMPLEGGDPELITHNGLSYIHGWSPNGKELSFCGERQGVFDVYTIDLSTKTEKCLTNAEGQDDSPEYSPDGKFIYFNSVRTGRMQIWRMKADGSEQQQITFGEYNDWFPHISPNGKWMVFLSYNDDVDGHPANKQVRIRLMNIETSEIQTIIELKGGQGTINAPSWAPNSKSFAFISYQ
jgi:Tol biopolymer transport system component